MRPGTVGALAAGAGACAAVLAALTPTVVHEAAAWPWWLRVPVVTGYLGAWGALGLVAGAAAAEWRLRRVSGGPSGEDGGAR